MLSIAAERSLSLSSNLCRAGGKSGIRLRFLHSNSERPTAFAYLSKRRNQQTITIAMSSLSRRHASSSSPGPSTKSTSKVNTHTHTEHNSHGHEHSHDGHDHSHSGIFHSHAHDHSEGAEQIMTALSKGTLDRGTRITLLGQSTILYPT